MNNYRNCLQTAPQNRYTFRERVTYDKVFACVTNLLKLVQVIVLLTEDLIHELVPESLQELLILQEVWKHAASEGFCVEDSLILWK